jgi:hypothetical protein
MHGESFVILLLFGTLFQIAEGLKSTLIGRHNEFSVRAENKERVLDFCNGNGCTFIGQVSFL